MSYLINEYKGNSDLKKSDCDCCGTEYTTNINRKRCSEKCSKIMKHKRHKVNRLFKVKHDKEVVVRTFTNIFGFVRRSTY
jgi:hypothetical protein